MKKALLTQFKEFVKSRPALNAISHGTWDRCAIGEFHRFLKLEWTTAAEMDRFANKVCFGVPCLYELLNSGGAGAILDGEEIIFSEDMPLDTYGELAAIIDDPEQACRDHIEDCSKI